MASLIARGVYAGSVGTLFLDLTSYVDMATRGRGASTLPARLVQRLAERLGWTKLATPTDTADEMTTNKQIAVGTLVGYSFGIGVGLVHAVLRPATRKLPFVLQSVLLGAAAMAASDVLAVRLELTDPKTWSASDWLSDALPHLVYGIATVLAATAFEDAPPEAEQSRIKSPTEFTGRLTRRRAP